MRSYYFHLLRTYGGVPIWLEPEVLNGKTDAVELRKARSTEAEVLAVVKSDIGKSVSLFGSSASPADKSQWSPNAALMLKGEIYLWSAKVYGTAADLTEAKNALNAVTGTSLQANFANAFSYSKKNNNEVILSIRFRVGEAEMTNYASFLYSTFNFDGQHYKDSLATGPLLLIPCDRCNQFTTDHSALCYTFELFQSYDVLDKRRNATFMILYEYYCYAACATVRNTALVKFLGTIDE